MICSAPQVDADSNNNCNVDSYYVVHSCSWLPYVASQLDPN